MSEWVRRPVLSPLCFSPQHCQMWCQNTKHPVKQNNSINYSKTQKCLTRTIQSSITTWNELYSHFWEALLYLARGSWRALSTLRNFLRSECAPGVLWMCASSRSAAAHSWRSLHGKRIITFNTCVLWVYNITVIYKLHDKKNNNNTI